MPTLKQITCNVEWAGSRLPLQEHHTIYEDGYVETFIAIPSTPTPFSMDGVYQCNRNRHNLEIPNEKTSRRRIEVDFIVRQKEELLWDGTFEGKQWKFEKVKIVPDSSVEDSERAPHDGEYVGTIEVVVLRCHPSDKRTVFGNGISSDESSDGNDKSTPGLFDGADDPRPESKSKSEYPTPAFSIDGGWDDWGPRPPPLDEPKLGRIDMISKNSGTWNPVGQASKGSNALEKNKRWEKRSESRDHFQLDFEKHRSPAGSQRGGSGQPRSTTDPENAPPLNLRGGGPGSYSIASSEAMRNWNSGPPALKEWTQGDVPSRGNGALATAFDPWTADLPTGNFNSEAQNKSPTEVGASGTRKKSSDKDSVVSRDPKPIPGAWGQSNDQDQSQKDDWGGNDNQNQGNNRNDWGASGETGNGDVAWGGAQNTNAQNHDEWNLSGNNEKERDSDWNHNSGWNASKKDEKRDDGGWDPHTGTANGNQDDWGGNENNDSGQNGDWGATEDKEPKKDDEWGATAVDDAQHGNSWGGETGQQTDTWGGNDIKQVTTGAKDPEKQNKHVDNRPAASGEKAGSSLSFGNSRAKSLKLGSKAGSQSKPASVKSKAASTTSNKKPFTFDWLKPSLEKASNASGPQIAVNKASSPVTSLGQEETKPAATQVPPTFFMLRKPKPKPYWSSWRNPNAVAGAEIKEEQAPSPNELEEPVYSIPAEVAQRNMMSHQVRPGRPAAYTHKRNKPKYMDTHESPYAVFLFKYRDKEIIERMLKTTVAEPEVDEKARLASLSKQELIDELVKTKSKLSVVESNSSGQATFVKKLDEKLSRLETGKEDVPAIGDWVNTTSPTHGQGIGNASAWPTNHTQGGNAKVDSGNGNEPSNTNGGDKGGDVNNSDNANGSGGDSWGGNGDSNANGKSDWNNNGNGELPNSAQVNHGNGDDDWGTTDHDNGANDKDDNGWNGDDNGGGEGGWSNNNNNKNDDNGGDTKDAGNWGNNNDDTNNADDWGNDHAGGNDKGGDSWETNGGGENGGWGGNDGKKDDGNTVTNAGFDEAWGADTSGGGGGGAGGGAGGGDGW